MRLCFISEHYPPIDGGVATSTQRLARSLKKKGVSVHVFCFDSSRPLTSEDYLHQEVDEGVNITRVGPFFTKLPSHSESTSEKTRATLRRRAFEQIVKVVKPWKPDVLLSFYLLNAGYVANFVARELAIPHVAGIRGNDIGRNIFNVERFGVIRWITESAHTLVCVNQHLHRKLLLAFPETLPKTLVITNGVNQRMDDYSVVACREKVQLATGWNSTDLRLVFIGTPREKKGIASILRAMNCLGPHSQANLLIVGPEPSPTEMKHCSELWATLHHWGRLHATGWLDRSMVNEWAAGGDAILMPSLDDGMANGLLEGMTIGLCPVVSDIFDDIIKHGWNGLLIARGDDTALKSAISQLIGDRTMVQKLGFQASQTVRELTPEKEADAYLQAFQMALRGKRNVA